jgi:hypothetical protein
MCLQCGCRIVTHGGECLLVSCVDAPKTFDAFRFRKVGGLNPLKDTIAALVYVLLPQSYPQILLLFVALTSNKLRALGG